MITSTKDQAIAVDAFASIDPRRDATSGSDWFDAVRRDALRRFNELDLPTSRHEDWRFTSITPIRQSEFALPAADAHVSKSQLDPHRIPGFDGAMIVFVNGHFDEDLSDLSDLPSGVTVRSLRRAWTKNRDLLEMHLGKYAQYNEQAFTALNTAMVSDGLLIHVPRNKAIEQPIHLLNVVSETDAHVLINPRCLIVAEQGAAVSVVEDYVNLREDDVYLNNAVTEVVVGDNADVTHYLLDREGPKAYNISSLFVKQGRDSRFQSHSMLFGGSIVRNNVHPMLDGENAYSLLNGLYVLRSDQVADSHMRVEHNKAHCDSRQFYKGIMRDQSHGVFRGRIVVAQDAQKTDAKQSNQNLLLSEEASANTDPQLEIYADDVKCTHGATIGQIDRNQMFYLQARGVPKDMARAMIIVAFAAQSLDRMACEPVRNLMRDMLFERLPEGRLLQQLI